MENWLKYKIVRGREPSCAATVSRAVSERIISPLRIIPFDRDVAGDARLLEIISNVGCSAMMGMTVA